MNRYHNHTDPELVALLNQSDQTAFEEIYRRYANEMYRLARKNISRKEDCEEIIQDVFVSMWTRRETIEIASLKYYLLNAVRYKIIRYFRHNTVKRKFADHYQFFAEVHESVDRENHDVDTLITTLDKILDDLPERCQIAFRLRLYESFSNAEIAQKMGISKRTVEVYMLKAFEHLRSSYNQIFKVG